MDEGDICASRFFEMVNDTLNCFRCTCSFKNLYLQSGQSNYLFCRYRIDIHQRTFLAVNKFDAVDPERLENR